MVTLSSIVGFVITLLILSILVLIHEFGHFITAKKLGIKVEEFGFGFPPMLWGKKIGETLYSINWLPIGGFVKLYGEDEAGAGRVNLKQANKGHETTVAEDEKRAFFARSVGQRATVVVAGVIMNALLAFIIYYAFMGLAGFRTELPLLNNHKFFGVNQSNKLSGAIISKVVSGSPAEKAGLAGCTQKVCESIVTVNGKKPENSDEFIAFIKANSGKKVSLLLQDVTSRKERYVEVVPRLNPPKGQGALGVEFNMIEMVVLNYQTLVQKVLSGIIHPLNLMSYNFDVMRMLISQSIKSRDISAVSNGVSGPAGIIRVGGAINEIQNIKERVMQFLNLAGLLSISLAIFNILPIPALDGGRLFFILIEGLIGKKVSPRIEGLIHTAGMAVLLTLVLLVTFKDILQFFK